MAACAAAAAYRQIGLDVNARQALRAVVYDLAFWRPTRNLLLVGDSRIAALRCDQALRETSVLNLGVSGLTAGQLAARLELWLRPSRPFDRAVVWVGVNDIVHQRRKPEIVAADISVIVGKMLQYSRKVAVVAQIPFVEDPAADKTQRVNADLRLLQQALAARLAPLSHDGQVSSLVPFGLPPNYVPYLLKDSLHLNGRGQDIFCATLSSWIAAS